MLKKITSCFFACCLSISAHESRLELEYPTFKEMLHAFSAGHGASHLLPDEIRPFYEKFSDHLDDVIVLQKGASKDKYLGQLTGHVRLSNLSDEQKHKLYRASYERCLEEAEKGNEWPVTLYILIDLTNALTKSEVEACLNAEDKSLRMIAESTLKSRVFDEDRRKRASTNSDRKRPAVLDGDVTADKEQKSSPASPPWWIYGITGLFCVAGAVALIKMKKPPSPAP